MPAKMISDMPLPTPRSLICSPSHMMNAEPVVSVRMVIKRKADAGVINQRTDCSGRLVLQREGDRQRLHDAEKDRQVARVLRDLAAAEFAFFLQALEVRPDHGHQLQDDRGRDVGHDAQGENRQPAEIAAAEQVDDAQDRALILLEELRAERRY